MDIPYKFLKIIKPVGTLSIVSILVATPIRTALLYEELTVHDNTQLANRASLSTKPMLSHLVTMVFQNSGNLSNLDVGKFIKFQSPTANCFGYIPEKHGGGQTSLVSPPAVFCFKIAGS